MGFDPEDLEKKTQEIIQNRQSIIAQNIKLRKKDVSFVEPEVEKKSRIPRTSAINYRPKEKKSISPFANEDVNIPKKEKKIAFVGPPLDSEYFPNEKAKAKEERETSSDDGDEIVKEIRFQRDLKKFVRGTINSQVYHYYYHYIFIYMFQKPLEFKKGFFKY